MLNSNPLVDSATSDDEKPTSGLVYVELQKLSFQGPQVCERLCKHILTKLASPSAAVKLKSLLCCQQLLEKGNPHFQKELQLNAQAIRACLDFRGPIDPVRGDNANKAVRDKAGYILNTLYEKDTNQGPPVDPAPRPTMGGISSEHVRQPMIGFGSDGSSSGGSGSQIGSLEPTPLRTTFSSNMNTRFMTNTDYQPQGQGSDGSRGHSGFTRSADDGRLTINNVTEMTKNVIQQIGTTLHITSPQEKPQPVDKGRYVAPSIDVRPRTVTQPSASSIGIGPQGGRTEPVYQGNTGSTGSTGTQGHYGGFDLSPQVRGTSQMSGTEEYQIIDLLCSPGSATFPNPSRLQLSNFLAKAREEGIRMEVIFYLLEEQLSNQDWKRKLRALYGIHELITQQVPLAAHYFSDQGLHALLGLTNSVQKTVQDKAIQVIQQISPQSLLDQKDQQEADYVAMNSSQGSQPAQSGQPQQHLSNNPHLSSNSRKDRQSEQVSSIFQSLTVEIPVHTPAPLFPDNKPGLQYTKPAQTHAVPSSGQPLAPPIFGNIPPPSNLGGGGNNAPNLGAGGGGSIFHNMNTTAPIAPSNGPVLTPTKPANRFSQPQVQQPPPQQQPQSEQNIFDEILFPNQRSLLGSQSLLGESSPAKSPMPLPDFYTLSPSTHGQFNTVTATPEKQSGFNTGGLDLSALYSSPSTATSGASAGVYNYPGAYTSNDRTNATRLSQQTKDSGKPKDPFFFGDIKTLDMSL